MRCLTQARFASLTVLHQNVPILMVRGYPSLGEIAHIIMPCDVRVNKRVSVSSGTDSGDQLAGPLD